MTCGLGAVGDAKVEAFPLAQSGKEISNWQNQQTGVKQVKYDVNGIWTM